MIAEATESADYPFRVDIDSTAFGAGDCAVLREVTESTVSLKKVGFDAVSDEATDACAHEDRRVGAEIYQLSVFPKQNDV